jgi:hypothetical protein
MIKRLMPWLFLPISQFRKARKNLMMYYKWYFFRLQILDPHFWGSDIIYSNPIFCVGHNTAFWWVLLYYHLTQLFGVRGAYYLYPVRLKFYW